MSLHSLWNRFRSNDLAAIVLLSVAIAAGLATFEYVSTYSASVRSLPVYGNLPMYGAMPMPVSSRPRIFTPAMRKAARLKNMSGADR